MSRFAIRDAGCTVAVGMCIDLVAKKQFNFFFFFFILLR